MVKYLSVSIILLFCLKILLKCKWQGHTMWHTPFLLLLMLFSSLVVECHSSCGLEEFVESCCSSFCCMRLLLFWLCWMLLLSFGFLSFVFEREREKETINGLLAWRCVVSSLQGFSSFQLILGVHKWILEIQFYSIASTHPNLIIKHYIYIYIYIHTYISQNIIFTLVNDFSWSKPKG
jgi:hypothetical protein